MASYTLSQQIKFLLLDKSEFSSIEKDWRLDCLELEIAECRVKIGTNGQFGQWPSRFLSLRSACRIAAVEPRMMAFLKKELWTEAIAELPCLQAIAECQKVAS